LAEEIVSSDIDID
jgi:hypothetical protein